MCVAGWLISAAASLHTCPKNSWVWKHRSLLMLLPNARYKYSGSSQSRESTARNRASYGKQTGAEQRRRLGGTRAPGLPKRGKGLV